MATTEAPVVADHILETRCSREQPCTRGGHGCCRPGCDLGPLDHPEVPRHPYVGCDIFHGIPHEEPGCYGADRCHALDCGLVREDHPEAKAVTLTLEPAAPMPICGHTHGVTLQAEGHVSLLYRLWLLLFGNIVVHAVACVDQDGRHIHTTATYGVAKRLPYWSRVSR